MDKVLRNALIVGILLVGVSTFYYLVIYIPQRDQARSEQQKEDKFMSECIEEKKEVKKQMLEIANDCENLDCSKKVIKNLSPGADYIQTCMDRKRQGLPTAGY